MIFLGNFGGHNTVFPLLFSKVTGGTMECNVLLVMYIKLREEMVQLTNLKIKGFPGGSVVKNPPANAGDTGSSPGPGRSHMQWSN